MINKTIRDTKRVFKKVTRRLPVAVGHHRESGNRKAHQAHLWSSNNEDRPSREGGVEETDYYDLMSDDNSNRKNCRYASPIRFYID